MQMSNKAKRAESSIALKLRKCPSGFGCVITMFCSTLGCAPEQAAKVLKQVVKDDRDEDIADMRLDYAKADWLKGLEKMGARVRDTNLAVKPYRARIDEAVPRFPPGPLYIVYCELPTGGPTHVFATQNGKVVDTYTNGEIIDFVQVPPSFPPYEVERIYVVERANIPRVKSRRAQA